MIAWVKKMIFRFRRLLTFAVCGVINTGVHWGIFALCFRAFGLPAWLSHGLGYALGSVCGYFLNSNLTFKEGKGRARAQFAQYVGIDAVLIVTSSLLMKLLESTGLNVWLLEMGLTVVFGLLHYILYKFVVFRIKKEDDR